MQDGTRDTIAKVQLFPIVHLINAGEPKLLGPDDISECLLARVVKEGLLRRFAGVIPSHPLIAGRTKFERALLKLRAQKSGIIPFMPIDFSLSHKAHPNCAAP